MTWVCDGCMRRVGMRDVAVWADFEHVLCHRCDRLERDRSTEAGTDRSTDLA